MRLLVLMLMASPTAAQDLVDFDLLLQQNADRVVVTTDAAGLETRTLEMPGGVIVSCTDEGCAGMDMSAAGAVGCVWSTAMGLRAVAEVCGMPEETRAQVGEVHDRLTAFAAKNAVPPRGSEEMDGYYLDMVARYRGEGDGGVPLACEALVGPDSNVQQMIDALVSPSGDAGYDLDALLATPRLPVMNPCF